MYRVNAMQKNYMYIPESTYDYITLAYPVFFPILYGGVGTYLAYPVFFLILRGGVRTY